MFALLVPSCCDKTVWNKLLSPNCYKVGDGTDLLQVVPTRLIYAVRNKLLRACCHQLVNNLLTTCYVQTISDLLEQLVASLLPSTTFIVQAMRFLRANKMCSQQL